MMKKFETEVRLSREIDLLDATMIGSMIGAGIFDLIGTAAVAGSYWGTLLKLIIQHLRSFLAFDSQRKEGA
jgi:amino acid transporter